ncbi:hypothetical protein INR49_009681, partial [Caranx melampygus]
VGDLSSSQPSSCSSSHSSPSSPSSSSSSLASYLWPPSKVNVLPQFPVFLSKPLTWLAGPPALKSTFPFLILRWAGREEEERGRKGGKELQLQHLCQTTDMKSGESLWSAEVNPACSVEGREVMMDGEGWAGHKPPLRAIWLKTNV